MEVAASQPLISIESFSYRWLLNLNNNPSSILEFDDQVQGQDDNSSSFRYSSLGFIEMDPRLPASRRFYIRASGGGGSHDFNFTFPVASSSPVDELISDGLILMQPLFIDNSMKKVEDQETDSSSHDHNDVTRLNMKSDSSCSNKIRRNSISKRFFLKYFAFFMAPFCKKICNRRRSRGLARVESVNSSCDNWRRSSSCDSESSIHEAVLHCKRSIGTQ
ncbi:probable membrane-associated kinase regulator 6 [Impatiens glandulifera]|uniref:probable membrane-associated kinase regulator 6 n=1 Tax=Impatiens glandulifera TaxID=253017 RepID=UPI001FB1308E|nr:probable membrane-associated kinase regulator 6 [Impatiens glandulifera]